MSTTQLKKFDLPALSLNTAKDIKLTFTILRDWLFKLTENVNTLNIEHAGGESTSNTNKQILVNKTLDNPIINAIQFNTDYVDTNQREGTITWNKEHHTLNIQPDRGAALLQVGQEEWIHVYNGTASTIFDGAVVYISGIDTTHPAVMLAKADTLATAKAVGIATTNIESGTYGFVTCRGVVRSYNTSTFAPASVLYLSSTTAGALTTTQPLPNAYSVPVAISITQATDGLIYVNVGNPAATLNATEIAINSKDPTGFLEPASITVAYDETTRKVTLTGNLAYVWRGVPLALTSPWTSDAHATTAEAGHFLSSTDGTTFTWSTTPWLFSYMMVAYVWYGTTNKFAIREVHGTMPWQVHEEFHTMVRTYRKFLNGTIIPALIAGTYTLASTTATNKRPDVAAIIVKDEDVESTNVTLTSKLYTKLYLTGTTAAPVNTFVVETAEIVTVSGTAPVANLLTAGTWTQTAMTVNDSYMSVWLVAVPATADTASQKFRFIWVEGQTISLTVGPEQALTPESLELGPPRAMFTEFIFLTQIILRYLTAAGGTWEIYSVKDLTRRIGA